VVETDVDRRRLHAPWIERIEAYPARRDRRADVTIGKDHPSEYGPPACRRRDRDERAF
jgi:hypothetical protein